MAANLVLSAGLNAIPSFSSNAVITNRGSRTPFLREPVCSASSSTFSRRSWGVISTKRGKADLSSSSSRRGGSVVLGCLESASPSPPPSSSFSSSRPKTRLYVSGLSFRTNKQSLQNAFQQFGDLLNVNLVMDKIANRSRGFAFLRYTTEEDCKKAIEGMHGKFLDGRVIFVEFAKPRSEFQSAVQKKPT